MPRVPFTPENKAPTTSYDYPKLKLKSGEHARVVLLEDPVMEYVHTLRAPQIINGVPQMGTEKRKDGTEYQDYKKDFVSRPLCTGDLTVLSETGIDTQGCAMCRMAEENPTWMGAPQRRYAMHVVRYRTKAGGFALATPFAVELLVWGFTDMVFNTIVDAKTEWGDLRKHDLLLGPCSNEMFQKFDINVGAKAEWMDDKERQQLTVETFKNNQIPDLSIACGAKKEERWLLEDLNKIRLAWAVVERSSATPGQVIGNPQESLDSALSSLLDGVSSTPAAATAPPEETQAFHDPTPSQLAETPSAATSPAADSGDTSFEDLLADLK